MRVNEKNLIEDLEPTLPLIYIDESGSQSDDTRFHSYSYIGTRAESTFNWQVKNSCVDHQDIKLHSQFCRYQTIHTHTKLSSFKC